jgi:oxidase EvaA
MPQQPVFNRLPSKESKGSSRLTENRNRKSFDPAREADRLRRRLQKVLWSAGESVNAEFYLSAVTEYNPFCSTEEVALWLQSLNEKTYFSVERLPLKQMRRWTFEEETQNLHHETGGFFSIRGLSVRTNYGPIQCWSQPIIYQSEIGLLGILTKRIDGILYFLMQAKAEPGNLNTFQLSPTVQATKSNFTRLHGGKPTAYLEYFLGTGPSEILIDQLQSEQGARFYKKRNRNMIVRVPDDYDIEPSLYHKWLTLGQLLQLTGLNNTVNMDTRSVVSCISFDPEAKTSLAQVNGLRLKACLESSRLIQSPVSPLAIDLMLSNHANSRPLYTLDNLISKVTREKSRGELSALLIPLKEVQHWEITAEEILHEERKYFSVIGVRVETDSREVPSWDQPILEQQSDGIVGFIARSVGGTLHFLVQMRIECGNMDILELAPTVQCITDSYAEGELPPYAEYFTQPCEVTTMFDILQSEEGGRFYREANRNVISLAKDNLPLDEEPRYVWMTLCQLKSFIKYNNYLNVEARSLLSCLRMI